MSSGVSDCLHARRTTFRIAGRFEATPMVELIHVVRLVAQTHLGRVAHGVRARSPGAYLEWVTAVAEQYNLLPA
jgi:hypothetical protein